VTRPELDGVEETLLWTLHHRAEEARRPDRVLDDPVAVDLVGRLDYDWSRVAGGPLLAQWQALRARRFDDEVRRFLAAHPGGTVVALGEGLETQFWRVDDGRVRWLSVDLPRTVALRERLLPADPRLRAVVYSATDPHWVDEVDGPALVTAQGLLMYLQPDEVHALVERCAARAEALVFDAVPPWLAEQTRKRAGAEFAPPPWAWTMSAAEERRLAALPGVARLEPLLLPRGRGAFLGAVLPVVSRLPPVRRQLLSVYRLAFAAASSS
jgi:O-methyltransferase involved in polyketide biosynthesis